MEGVAVVVTNGDEDCKRVQEGTKRTNSNGTSFISRINIPVVNVAVSTDGSGR